MKLGNYLSNLKKKIIKPRIVREVGIDLGTANTVVYVRGEGIVIDEPTYIAKNNITENVENIGVLAKAKMGRTPTHIDVIRPLKNGVISNYEVTEQMLTEFLKKVNKEKGSTSKVIICVPSGVTQVEKRAVVNAVKDAGVNEVYLVEEPIAAAIGSGIDLFEAKGHLIVDIGGGTTEIAFIVSGGSSLSKSIKVAGDHMNDDIIEFIRDRYSLLIGEKTAEALKIAATSAKDNKISYEIRGRELISGLPKNVAITGEVVEQAILRNVQKIIDSVKLTLEDIAPEISADIYETGIYLSGGGANIRILKELMEKEFKLKVTISKEPIYAVINGISKIYEDFDKYSNVIIAPNME